MLQGDQGLGPFLDNYIVILAGRHGAPVTCGAFPKSNAAAVAAWRCVASAVQSALAHAQPTERAQLAHVEALMFTPQICHHRASYVLWKARREAAQLPGPSGFNITRDSVGHEISEIYQHAKRMLPTIATEDDETGDDDDAVEPLHLFDAKTAEEVVRDQRIAEAEDDLMRKIQELQVEFFDKHRKWVDAPTSLTPPATTPEKRAITNKKKSEATTLDAVNFCIENINRKLLIEVTAEELAVVLDSLDISEYKQAFRRTTGRVLKTLLRSELQERFGGDVESADLLWAWISERRQISAPSSKSSTPTKAATRDDVAKKQVSAMLDMFRRVGGGDAVPQASSHYLDPLANLKKAMNPHRPLRPSQVDYDHEESQAAADDDGLDPEGLDKPLVRRQAAKQEAPVALDPRRGAAALSSNKAAESSPQSHAAVSAASAAASRSNRWQVVEYDDDDDDDE